MNIVASLLLRNLVADAKSIKLTAIRLVLQPAIYLFVFGYVVGGMLPAQNGGSYAEVMAPGIIAISILTGPFVTVAGSILSGYYFRTMEGWLLAPITLRTLMLAQVFGGVFYGLASGTIVALLIWLILGIAPQSLLVPYLIGAAGALFFSLLSIVILLLPETPDKGQELFSFLLMPMTFFGCTFYSYSMLEPPFSYIALLLPTTYLSEGLRAAYNPSVAHMDITYVSVGLAAIAAALFPLADWVFRRRFRDFLW